MAWAQFVQMGMQAASSVFGMYSDEEDARTSKRQGLDTANSNEERVRRSSAKQLGAIRANMAESGFQQTGSALDLYAQNVGNAELDALTKRYEGQMAAWKADAQIERSQSYRRFMLDPIFGNSKGGSLLFGGGVSYFYGDKVAKG